MQVQQYFDQGSQSSFDNSLLFCYNNFLIFFSVYQTELILYVTNFWHQTVSHKKSAGMYLVSDMCRITGSAGNFLNFFK